ncbi:hypothetical protein PHLGIDRAFT_400420 [Phlebiopsis gigantea 11061_1 CR5-6]|uniref:Uncharacterized protein n=1 Tax=Phlebiopsis gigantea (strain 11061_1 CR5-6) TaxID=745531 RepID=A0A0C3P2E2_PHLG1|nr:hypothetical protein PHLGIDRAFT_400420 [Phlebiopsis gigantea 11061_1 CR5-6]
MFACTRVRIASCRPPKGRARKTDHQMSYYVSEFALANSAPVIACYSSSQETPLRLDASAPWCLPLYIYDVSGVFSQARSYRRHSMIGERPRPRLQLDQASSPQHMMKSHEQVPVSPLSSSVKFELRWHLHLLVKDIVRYVHHIHPMDNGTHICHLDHNTAALDRIFLVIEDAHPIFGYVLVEERCPALAQQKDVA